MVKAACVDDIHGYPGQPLTHVVRAVVVEVIVCNAGEIGQALVLAEMLRRNESAVVTSELTVPGRHSGHTMHRIDDRPIMGWAIEVTVVMHVDLSLLPARVTPGPLVVLEELVVAGAPFPPRRADQPHQIGAVLKNVILKQPLRVRIARGAESGAPRQRLQAKAQPRVISKLQ